MKKYGKIVCFVVSLVIILDYCLVTQGQTPKGNGDISPKVTKSYFADSANEIPREIRPFLNPTNAEFSLPPDNYHQVCENFAWWARKVIKPEYVPNDKFIVTHLLLLPATPDCKQDMAFLSCQKEGMVYMIVQTGGVNGRVFFAADRPDKVSMASGSGAKAAWLDAVTNYFNVSQEEMSDFEVEKRGGLHILSNVIPKTNKGKLTRAEGILAGTQIAVSVLKRPFADTASAHEPTPEKWFEWEMTKSLKKPFPAP